MIVSKTVYISKELYNQWQTDAKIIDGKNKTKQ